MRLQNSSFAATTSRPPPTASAPAVGDEVGDRHSVSCPSAGDHRNRHAAIARATYFLVECPEVFIQPPPRATITTSTPGTRPVRRSAPRHVRRGVFALDARLADHQVRVGVAPPAEP